MARPHGRRVDVDDGLFRRSIRRWRPNENGLRVAQWLERHKFKRFSGLPGGFRFSSGYFFDAGFLRLLVEFLAQWHLRLVSTAASNGEVSNAPTTIDTTAFLFVASGMPSESTLKKGVSGDALPLSLLPSHLDVLRSSFLSCDLR